jgi:NADPH:quinone reductase-like Zn-dependent oxidoreductase
MIVIGHPGAHRRSPRSHPIELTSVAKLLGVSLRGGKDVAQVQAQVTTRDLKLLCELIEAGKVRAQIDRRSRFAEVPAAIAYLEQGHARAKMVVTMA